MLAALFFVTPALVVDFLAVAFLVVGFVTVVVDLRFRSGVVEIDGSTRGLEWPVEARVAAISIAWIATRKSVITGLEVRLLAKRSEVVQAGGAVVD